MTLDSLISELNQIGALTSRQAHMVGLASGKLRQLAEIKRLMTNVKADATNTADADTSTADVDADADAEKEKDLDHAARILLHLLDLADAPQQSQQRPDIFRHPVRLR
jgi:hypothetical protein